MALLRSFDDHEYWPEYGTFVLRDSGPFGPARVRVNPLLEEGAVDTQPGGSIARAGDGWLDGTATDRYHAVLLEAHDTPPEPDHADWADVVETPLATGGTVGLAMVTGGPGRDGFRLGQPGLYRVRFGRRPAAEGDRYRLQFWPVPAPPDPPRWILRSRPFVTGGNDGWDDALGWHGRDLLWAVPGAAGGGPATRDDIAAWAVRHQRPAGWLDEPIAPAEPAGAPPTDPEAARQRTAYTAELHRRHAALVDAARQLGVAEPVRRGDLLPVLVAAGVLTTADVAGQVGYLVTAPPRPAWEVLRLPDERVAGMRAHDARHRYCYAATDVVSLLAWAQEGPTVVTMSWLAERLLASPAAVRETLGYAVDTGLLEPYTEPADPGEPVRLVVRGKEIPRWRQPPRRLQPATAPPPGRGGVRAASGAPPRAGFVGADGDLVVWHDNQPVILSRWPGTQIQRAMQSRPGTVLLASDQAALVRPDGEFHLLGTDIAWAAALDPAGERLAVVEWHIGRRSRQRLHLINLADGTRQTMPGDLDDPAVSVIAVHDGAVYLIARGSSSMRWVPGRDPEPLPYLVRQIDPYTGVSLAADQEPGSLLVHPDGRVHRIAVDPLARLAPGATHLYTWVYRPPALALFDVAAPDRRTDIALPGGSRTSPGAPGGPIWEDRWHVLVPAEHGSNDLGAPLVRADVRTGALEAIDLPTEAGYRFVLVEPLPDVP